jgi:non-specific serine/threonine protein kinase
MAAVLRLLETNRLVSLVGPGGVGKTRLCVRVMADARGRFADGAAFVGLAELRDPDLLGSAVAYGLGLADQVARTPTQVVVDHLRDREFLLVLDNCEHLLTAVASFLKEVLQHCPRVVVLATSRQSLAAPGEQLFPVPPLEVPGEAAAPSDMLTRYHAVKLFAHRASAVLPGFAVTEGNSQDLARACRKLEGLPLAIELAARRLRSLSLAQIADRAVRLAGSAVGSSRPRSTRSNR